MHLLFTYISFRNRYADLTARAFTFWEQTADD